MSAIFDLEQAIMKAWGTRDDLELIYHGTDHMSQDEIQNAILGLIEIHELRCKKAFELFEDVTKEYHQMRKRVEERPSNEPNQPESLAVKLKDTIREINEKLDKGESIDESEVKKKADWDEYMAKQREFWNKLGTY